MGAQQSSHREVEDLHPSQITHEGLLSKESETLKTWNTRYATLKNRTLSYWDSEKEAKDGTPPRAVIDISGCFVALASSTDLEHMSSFMIRTPSDPKRLISQRNQTQSFFRPSTDAELLTWVEKLQQASREPWAADSERCTLCSKPFDVLTRPHHCRRCGQCVCEACSPEKQAMPEFAYPEPVRVCTDCRGQSGPVLPLAERQRLKEAAAAAAVVEKSKSEAAERARSKEQESEARKAALREKYLAKK